MGHGAAYLAADPAALFVCLPHLPSERLESRPERSEPEHAYETPLATVQRILASDTELAELKIVREWLQDLLPVVHTVEVRKGYLSFTKNALRANRTQLPSGGRRGNERLVDQLDPDAAVRGPGVLDVEDVNYEKALLRTLFEYVRAGELDKALHLCTQTSQPWRAASLRGALFYHDPGLSDVGGAEAMGDRLRSVWRRVAEKAASSVCATSTDAVGDRPVRTCAVRRTLWPSVLGTCRERDVGGAALGLYQRAL